MKTEWSCQLQVTVDDDDVLDWRVYEGGNLPEGDQVTDEDRKAYLVEILDQQENVEYDGLHRNGIEEER